MFGAWGIGSERVNKIPISIQPSSYLNIIAMLTPPQNHHPHDETPILSIFPTLPTYHPTDHLNTTSLTTSKLPHSPSHPPPQHYFTPSHPPPQHYPTILTQPLPTNHQHTTHLDIIRMTRAIYMAIMAFFSGVGDGGGIDGNASSSVGGVVVDGLDC